MHSTTVKKENKKNENCLEQFFAIQ